MTDEKELDSEKRRLEEMSKAIHTAPGLITDQTNIEKCVHCKFEFEMHEGSNVCPSCGMRTFVTPPEY